MNQLEDNDHFHFSVLFASLLPIFKRFLPLKFRAFNSRDFISVSERGGGVGGGMDETGALKVPLPVEIIIW